MLEFKVVTTTSQNTLLMDVLTYPLMHKERHGHLFQNLSCGPIRISWEYSDKHCQHFRPYCPHLEVKEAFKFYTQQIC